MARAKKTKTATRKRQPTKRNPSLMGSKIYAQITTRVGGNAKPGEVSMRAVRRVGDKEYFHHALIFANREKAEAYAKKKRWIIENPSKVKTAVKKTVRALKGAARGVLGTGASLLESGAAALNPRQNAGRSGRELQPLARYEIYWKLSHGLHVVGVVSATSPKQALSIAKDRFAASFLDASRKGRRVLARKLGYVKFDNPKRKNKTIIKARKVTVVAPNPRKRTAKKRNVEQGYYDPKGQFHPVRAAEDYSSRRVARGKGFRGEVFARDRRTKQWHRVPLGKSQWASKAEAIKAANAETARRGKRRQYVAFKAVPSGQEPNPKRNAGRALTGKARRKTPTESSFSSTAGLWYSRGDSTAQVMAKLKARGFTAAQAKRVARSARSSSRYAHRLERESNSPKRESAVKKTVKRRRNQSPDAIRKDFAGTVHGEKTLFFPEGTPQGLAKLGKLISITTEEGTLKPTNGTAWLVCDTKGKLHVGSTSNEPLWDGSAHSFGSVKQVEYETSKPHLGIPNPIVFYHKLGEDSGKRPTLHADGKGGLKFRAGNYKITREGIVD